MKIVSTNLLRGGHNVGLFAIQSRFRLTGDADERKSAIMCYSMRSCAMELSLYQIAPAKLVILWQR